MRARILHKIVDQLDYIAISPFKLSSLTPGQGRHYKTSQSVLLSVFTGTSPSRDGLGLVCIARLDITHYNDRIIYMRGVRAS